MGANKSIEYNNCNYNTTSTVPKPAHFVPTVLFYGAKGWIAQYFIHELERNGRFKVFPAKARADDVEAVEAELDTLKPDRVVSFIGRTHGDGIGTIDYLEQPGKLKENVRDNLFGPVALALLCSRHGIHFTYLGTGCIFSDDDPSVAKPYDERSVPTFFGSSYSTVKGYTDRLMHMFGRSVLNVRIRMPITADESPRNFITKIVNYPKICSIPNSMTVLPTLLPLLVDMVAKQRVGTINLVNPGLITHDRILHLYRDIVNPDHSWENITVEEQDSMLASKRSNNALDTTQLQNDYPHVPKIEDAIRMCLKEISNCRGDLELENLYPNPTSATNQ